MFSDEGLEVGDGLGGAVFAGEVGGEGGGAGGAGGIGQKFVEVGVEVFGPPDFAEAEADAEAFHLDAEIGLIADVGDDDLGFAGVEGAGGGAGAAVVDDGAGVAEELVVGDFADDFDVGLVAEFGELGPAALHDDFAVGGPGADEAFHGGPGVFVNHAAEGEDGHGGAAGEGGDLGVEGGVGGGLPAAVADEAEAGVDLGAGDAEDFFREGDDDAGGGAGEKITDFGEAGGAKGVGDGGVDDAIDDGVGGFPEPAIPGAAEGAAEPGGRGNVFRRVVGRGDDVGGEGEGGKGHAVAVGDAFVHGKEVAGNDEVGLGHGSVHAADHLRDVFVGADVELAELVDGGANLLEAAHPV